MKKVDPRKFILVTFGLCTIFSIGGAVSSSLAWYAYASRGSLTYSGTSVFDNGQLQIGVKSETKIDRLVSEGNMIQYPTNEEISVDYEGPYYYFAPAGEGLTSNLLNIYLAEKGYASNELSPVTTGEYDYEPTSEHHHFSLLNPPSSETRTPNRTRDAASMASYSKITFAFRTFFTNSSGEREFAGDREIWLTYAQARASVNSSGSVSKAMRMYIERNESFYGADNGFVFNPSSKNDGETKVGGMLNLGYDDYYDFDENGEIIYGEYTVDPNDTGIVNSQYDGEDELADVNGSGSTTADTFTAKHSPESPAYYPDLSKYTFKTAKYKGTNSVLQTKDSNGLLFNPTDEQSGEEIKTSVCKTGGAEKGYIGEFDATIYLEGWDFSVIDQEYHHRFDFQLRFETNRIQES